MEICTVRHEEVCYDSNVRCPVCAVTEEKDDEIDALSDKVEELKGELQSQQADKAAVKESVD